MLVSHCGIEQVADEIVQQIGYYERGLLNRFAAVEEDVYSIDHRLLKTQIRITQAGIEQLLQVMARLIRKSVLVIDPQEFELAIGPAASKSQQSGKK